MSAREAVEPPASSSQTAPGGPRAFVAFAGGGAKGIAHVGALSALEQRDVEVVGYAGASAGAIVATLAAAGFKSRQIIHPTEPTSILDELRRFDQSLKRPTDLFGPGGWAQVAIFRALHGLMTPARLLWATVATVVALWGSAVALGLYGYPWGLLIIFAWLVVVGVLAAFGGAALLGLARLHTLESALSQLLSERLFPKDQPVAPEDEDRVVRFRHFPGGGRPALKIVAANLSTRELQLFSADTSGEVPVAKAVAASICLPVIFDLWLLEGHRYVDGGVVSNLPAWPFDEERALDGDAMTIAFSIGDPDAANRTRPATTRISWPFSVVETMLSGSVSLSTRAVGLSEFITLTPRIGLMQFDLDTEPTRTLLADMTAQAKAEIDERLFAFPDAYRAACQQVVDLTEQTLNRAPQIRRRKVRKGRVRVAVAMPPERYFHSLQLKYGANFQDDPDQGIVLPKRGSLVGLAWDENKPQFDVAPFPPELSLPGAQFDALRRLFWRDLAWSLRIPISGADKAVRCVVTVDGSDVLRDIPETREAFEDLTDQIEKIFSPVVRRLKKANPDG